MANLLSLRATGRIYSFLWGSDTRSDSKRSSERLSPSLSEIAIVKALIHPVTLVACSESYKACCCREWRLSKLEFSVRVNKTRRTVDNETCGSKLAAIKALNVWKVISGNFWLVGDPETMGIKAARIKIQKNIDSSLKDSRKIS